MTDKGLIAGPSLAPVDVTPTNAVPLSVQLGPLERHLGPRSLQAPPEGGRRGDDLPSPASLLPAALPRRREHQELHLGPDHAQRGRNHQDAHQPLW